jgi:hypothetical protein
MAKNLTQDVILTTDYDDPDPEGVDVYGMIPLISELEDDDDDSDSDDDSGASKSEDDDGDKEEAPIVEASSMEVEVPEGEELPDDDDDAFYALTAHGATDMSPGEAEDLIQYMRPASQEELDFEEETPFMKDLRWVDDPAHTADVLKAGKNSKGLTQYLRDTSYGETMTNEDEFADKHDTDAIGRYHRRDYNNRYGVGPANPANPLNPLNPSNDGQRRHKRRHHRHHRQGQQPGALQPGQPGYVPPYGLQPGQPGYVAPLQPGQPGYVAPPYNANPYGANPYGASPYGVPYYGQAPAPVNPAIAAQVAEYQAQHGGVTPPVLAPAPYVSPYGQSQYNPPYGQPLYGQTPYTPPAVPPVTPTTTDYVIEGEAKKTVMRGLARKLVVEHANWLADSDKSSGITVRPRAYYENVAKLWAKDKLTKSRIPVTTSGSASPSPGTIIVGANRILAETAGQRARFSHALGFSTDMGGWNPFSAAKNAVKAAVKYTVVAPLKYGYKYGVKAPLTYTYKGVKYVGKMAEKMALAPLRAIIRRFTGTMITRRANLLAKQKGLATPGPAEKASAASWAKSYVRAKGGKYGGAIASLMGGNRAEYGMHTVDISMGRAEIVGGADVIGLGKSGTAGLIILGPLGLIALLTGLVKTSSPAAPPPAPGSPEADAEAAAAAQDAGDGSEDQGTADVPPDYGSQDAGAPDDGAPDAGDSSGARWNLPLNPRKRVTVTIEQLNSMNPRNRSIAQRLVQAGRIRLA